MLRGWRLGLAITFGLGAAGSLPLLFAYFDGHELNSLYRSFVGLWVNAVVSAISSVGRCSRCWPPTSSS